MFVRRKRVTKRMPWRDEIGAHSRKRMPRKFLRKFGGSKSQPLATEPRNGGAEGANIWRPEKRPAPSR
jgi:hypothetical protein